MELHPRHRRDLRYSRRCRTQLRRLLQYDRAHRFRRWWKSASGRDLVSGVSARVEAVSFDAVESVVGCWAGRRFAHLGKYTVIDVYILD